AGRLNLISPGNLDLAGTQLRTQDIEISSGLRVVGGDMGPILGDASATRLVWQNHTGGEPGNPLFQPGKTVPGTPIPYNLAAGSDGRNQLTAFVVTFDRVIDPTSFGLGDVKVLFRGPNDDPTGAGSDVQVLSVTPLDDIRDPVDDKPFGSKRFLVRLLNPQNAVGTYSYLIGSHTDSAPSLIPDRVRRPILAYANTGAPKTLTYTGAPDQIVDFSGATPPLTTSITVPPPPPPAGFPAGV